MSRLASLKDVVARCEVATPSGYALLLAIYIYLASATTRNGYIGKVGNEFRRVKSNLVILNLHLAKVYFVEILYNLYLMRSTCELIAPYRGSADKVAVNIDSRLIERALARNLYPAILWL